jgi:hypothetical protein
MAVICIIYGQSGTGKSSSMRNFKKGEVSVVNVTNKPLPFRADFAVATSKNYEQITQALKKSESKSIIIDDSTYLLVDEYMRKSAEKGFDKFVQLANNFYNLLNFCTNELDNDKIVYFIGQSEVHEDGREHFRTVGKMLDSMVCIEGLSTIVLKSVVKDGRYCFSTKNNGFDTVKTPLGMFSAEEEFIDNDLKAVDSRIRQFWNMSKNDIPANKIQKAKE